MKRLELTPRTNWVSKLKAAGCENPVYESERGTTEHDWREDAAYQMSQTESETLWEATRVVNSLVLDALELALDSDQVMQTMGIPLQTHALIRQAWQGKQRNLALQFDWSFENGLPKLIDINADGLLGFVLAGPAQREWATDVFPGKSQWNDIENRLSQALAQLGVSHLTFAYAEDDQAMLNEVGLFRRLAGSTVETSTLEIDQIGYNEENNAFVAMVDNSELEAVYSMVPMSLLVEREFAKYWYSAVPPKTRFFEPIWTLLLNKAFLAFLYNQFPDNLYLLPTYLESDSDTEKLSEAYVSKPFWGSDGYKVQIILNGAVAASGEDDGEDAQFIAQQYCPLPTFNGRHAAVSTWVIGNQPAGLSIREGQLITDYYAPVIPHIIA